MPIETFPFDVTDYLATREERAEYLSIAIESDDPTEIDDAMKVIAEAEARYDGKGARDVPVRLADPETLADLSRSLHARGLRLRVESMQRVEPTGSEATRSEPTRSRRAVASSGV